ncbi:MAG: hypothetical protein JRN06_04180 [Nitrososphaerota archaeon]|nr:hypothetical protein [Nitrososphaerota archaeon]MDG7023818.1 hypothetical protein [Nitrososphaerota archaeon]
MTRFLPYADDSIWLLFGLGVAIIVGDLAASLATGEFGWATLGFLVTGILVSVSYYVVGTHPPRNHGTDKS